MRYFLSSNCEIIHGSLFCVEAYGGSLITMNPNDGRADCCNIRDGFIARKVRLIDFMDSFNGKIYALDSEGDNLLIFDLDKGNCQYIWLGCAREPKVNFAAFERYGTCYYIFPKYDNKVLVYDIEKNKITKTCKYINGKQEIQCACREENNVWILPKNTGRIYCFHLTDMEVQIYKLEVVLQNCVHAVFYGGYVYVLEKFGSVYRWDIKKALLQTVLKAGDDGKETMSRILYAGNKLILLPAYAKDIRILDLTAKEVQVYLDYPKDFFYYNTNWLKYYGYCEDEEYYYFAMCAGNYMLMVKKKTGEILWKRPILDILGEKVAQLLNNSGEYLFQEGALEIKDLLKLERKNSISGYGADVGRRVYENICSQGEI